MNWPLRRPQVPASCVALELTLVEKELVRTRGNVREAAKALDVPSVDLRKFVSSTPQLADAIYEEIELAIDEAQAVLWEGLRHEDLSKRLQAAIFILRHSEVARRRGWGRGRALRP
jgi:hypothetical protein